VLGGFNDGRFFLCPRLRAVDCPSGYTNSVTGFSASIDGGASVFKSNDIPGISTQETDLTSQKSSQGFLVSWGDPSVSAAPGGNFYYSSLAIDPITGANGVMVAESNSSLWASASSCETRLNHPSSNPCWTAKLILGNLTYSCPTGGLCGPATLEDKDFSAVDLDLHSPYYGSVYVAWTHFFSNGDSAVYTARCSQALSCVMISGGSASVVSGSDSFADFATPYVGPDGTVYVSWCDFGTATTLGPVICSVRSSPPGGTGFGNVHEVMSFMGVGTDLPGYAAIQGFATEQFRAASILTFAADSSGATNSTYFAIALCTSGTYFVFLDSSNIAGDNPGTCGTSGVFFSRSVDRGAHWTAPVQVSKSAVVIQPSLAVDRLTGAVAVAYYSSEFDPFDHRLDVVASVSRDKGQTFYQMRVTPISNEPDADPNLFNYTAPFGGSFVVPQYGDYLTASALGGKIWVLFTGDYQAEQGTLQADPFLAWVSETQATLTLANNSADAAPGDRVAFDASGFVPRSTLRVAVDWNGQEVVLSNSTVSAGGTVAGNFTVPNVQSQVYPVIASDTSGTTATARLGVGQVSLTGVQSTLATVEGSVSSVAGSILGLRTYMADHFSSLSGEVVSINSSIQRTGSQLTAEVQGTGARIGASIAGLDSKVSGALSGATSTVSIIEYLVILLLVLVVAVLALQLGKRRSSTHGLATAPSSLGGAESSTP
jgi:hypothetical protein